MKHIFNIQKIIMESGTYFNLSPFTFEINNPETNKEYVHLSIDYSSRIVVDDVEGYIKHSVQDAGGSIFSEKHQFHNAGRIPSIISPKDVIERLNVIKTSLLNSQQP